MGWRSRRSFPGVPAVAAPDAGRCHCGSGRYLIPASAHLAAYSPVHSSAAVTKPSSTTSLTLSLVIATGVSSTDGTSACVVGSVTLLGAVCFEPLAREIASDEA